MFEKTYSEFRTGDVAIALPCPVVVRYARSSTKRAAEHYTGLW